MSTQFKFLSAAVAGAALLMIAGCGGGDTVAALPAVSAVPAAPAAPVAPTTADVSTTVVDGAIKDAVVCLDKNLNGICDEGEVRGRTDENGNVTLAVPIADVGKYPLIAVVGTDAVDKDNGKVLVAYTLSAPADRSGVVSPLTTMVQQTVASTGASTVDAAKSVQDAVGPTVSLFDDFTKGTPTDASALAKTLARLIVVTTQTQRTALDSAVGKSTLDNIAITSADLDKVIQKKLIELLPSLLVELAKPDFSSTDTEVRKAAMVASATTLHAASGLTAAAMTTVVAVNNAQVAPDVAAAPVAALGLASLSYTNASNYLLRVFTSSVAQNTPDAANSTRFVDRRSKSSAGNVANWGFGGDPARNADLHWTGTQWAACPINFESTSSLRDAQGNSTYNFCNGTETGISKRASFDIGGKTMVSVYDQIQAGGYTNLKVADTAVFASATFPSGSRLYYQSSTPQTIAMAFATGSGNKVKQYSAAVAAGVSSATACSGSTFPTTNANTLEVMVSSHGGIPCSYAAANSFVYAGTTYSSGAPFTWDGNSTLPLGTIGTVALNTGAAPGYYSGNTRIVVAFKGTGTNPVTYLACQERFTDGSVRNCKAIGTGSYTIAKLGDARVMTLNNLPLQAVALPNTRVYVERGGAVYVGYQNKLSVNNSARLNTVATKALLTQISIVPADPEVPLALTKASYQGSWDLNNSAIPTSAGINVSISATGTVVCTYTGDSTTFVCTLTLTNASTGAFTLSNTDGLAASGSLDFMTGTGSGTYHEPSSTPVDGSFVVQRR